MLSPWRSWRARAIFVGERRLGRSAIPFSVSGFARSTFPPLCGGEEPPFCDVILKTSECPGTAFSRR
jgi:hypothetical protein